MIHNPETKFYVALPSYVFLFTDGMTRNDMDKKTVLVQ